VIRSSKESIPRTLKENIYMHGNIYRDKIYPLQDRILKVLEELDLDFYLTGGTALSRCYLQHRYSDDLDLFVNGHSAFKNQCKTMINACKSKWHVDITTTTDSFGNMPDDQWISFRSTQRYQMDKRVKRWRDKRKSQYITWWYIPRVFKFIICQIVTDS